MLVAQSPLSIGGIVKGIIGYTAWPNARASLLVCVTRNGADSMDVRFQVEHSGDSRSLAVAEIDPNQALPAECNAIFFEGWSAKQRRVALQQIANRPILSLGRGPEFCSDGGMFCLDATDAGTHFEVNLDAVARSGLRVHSQVLRLAKQPTGAS